MPKTLWKAREKSVRKGLRSLLERDPEGLHDVRVALRRTAATAEALGRRKIARRSADLGHSLSELRQLEIDCRLLGRVRAVGLLPDDAAASLDARWNALIEAERRKAAKVAGGKKVRRLLDRLRRLARRRENEEAVRREIERRSVKATLPPPTLAATDRQLHKYRVAVKQGRYLAEDLEALGSPSLDGAIKRKREIQELLGRWNDVRLFRQRLLESRVEAEKTGAVTLALELDRLTSALERTVSAARRKAIERAARPGRPAVERRA